MTSWRTSLRSCRYCVQDRHPILLYSGVEMLGPDVAFEGPAPVPAGKTVALLFSTLKCSRHFIIVSFPRISTFPGLFASDRTTTGDGKYGPGDAHRHPGYGGHYHQAGKADTFHPAQRQSNSPATG